jgi:nucleotide-binding universal stress UspA family protein
MFRRILVPLDGSERAESVLPIAKSEAKSHSATVILLRVVPPIRHSLMLTPALLEQTTSQANKITEDYLRNVAERLRADGLTVETETLSGPPAQEILRYAEETDCDLIVIGSRGDTGALQWRFGSVSNKVIKTKTTMPVLVIST